MRTHGNEAPACTPAWHAASARAAQTGSGPSAVTRIKRSQRKFHSGPSLRQKQRGWRCIFSRSVQWIYLEAVEIYILLCISFRVRLSSCAFSITCFPTQSKPTPQKLSTSMFFPAYQPKSEQHLGTSGRGGQRAGHRGE